MDEVWKPVPSIPELEASSLGRIRGGRTGKMPHGGTRSYSTGPTYGLRRKTTGQFPWRMIIMRDGKNIKVHRLVCEAFHGSAPFDGAVVMHINECPLDNRPENLRWGTQKENLNMPGVKEYHRRVCREKMTSRKVA